MCVCGARQRSGAAALPARGGGAGAVTMPAARSTPPLPRARKRWCASSKRRRVRVVALVLSVAAAVYLGKPEALPTVQLQQPKFLSSPALPSARAISAPRVCTAAEVAVQVERFVPGESSCPSGEWWPALRVGGLRCRPLTFIQIGANKGFKLAGWIAQYAPALDVHPSRLSREYDLLFAREPITWFENSGGTCEDYREGPAAPRKADEPVCAGGDEWAGDRAGHRFTIHAFEPLPGNADVLRGALQSLMLLGNASDAVPPVGRRAGPWTPVDLHIHEAAVTGDATLTQIEFGRCNAGNERCGVRAASGPDDGDVYSKGRFVDATTVDKWLAEERIYSVDVLSIDTEGHDPSVLKGADGLLSRGGAAVVEFEIHYLRDWNSTALETVITRLDRYGYDCYMLQQRATVLRLTGCWNPRFDVKNWGNVMCVLRDSTLSPVMETFTPIFKAKVDATGGAARGSARAAALTLRSPLRVSGAASRLAQLPPPSRP